MNEKKQTPEQYGQMQTRSGMHTMQCIKNVIGFLDLPLGSSGLDAGCGVGLPAIWLGEAVGPRGSVTGIDISSDFLETAGRNCEKHRYSNIFSFRQGSIASIPFEDSTFDWIWCKDSFWPGRNMIEDPVENLRELKRVVRPGGMVALVYWSAQGFLPGYPALEARLYSAFSKVAPYLTSDRPQMHFLRALEWMDTVGLENTSAGCFAGCLNGPLNDEDKAIVHSFMKMFFDDLKPHVSDDDWQLTLRLCDPDCPDSLLHRNDYYSFHNYTVFKGIVQG